MINPKKGTLLTNEINFPIFYKNQNILLATDLFVQFPVTNCRKNCGHVTHLLFGGCVHCRKETFHARLYVHLLLVTSLYNDCQRGQDGHTNHCNATNWKSTPTCGPKHDRKLHYEVRNKSVTWY